MLGAALLTPKKTDAQKEKQGFIGKTMTFIKENVGKLSMLAMTPVLIEELMANHQGAKIAKQYLSGDALKPALKTNRWSAIGYISVIGVVGLAVSIGNKIRDMVANKVSS